MIDVQCGQEKVFTSLLPALAGTNLIYGMGMLELGMTFSYDQLLIDDEIAALVKRTVRGIDVNDDTLGVDLIKQIGPGGNFLAQEHTRAYMHSEQSKVTMTDRRNRGTWEKRGSKPLDVVAKERVKELLSAYKPKTLPEEVTSQFKSIIKELEEKVAAGEA